MAFTFMCNAVLPLALQLYIQPITDVEGTLDCFRFGISSSVNGLVIGATVMEGFYVAFDRAQKRVGFAVSTCAGEGLVSCHSLRIMPRILKYKLSDYALNVSKTS